MRRAVPTLALATALAAWVCDSARMIVWVGGYDLAVRVECPAGLPRAVSAQACASRGDAEEALADPRRSWPAVADPFDGAPLAAPVCVTGRQSGFGREYGRAQYRHLAVVAEFPDGRRVRVVTDISDGRESHVVTVALPP